MDVSFSGDAGFAAPSSQVDMYGIEDNLFGGALGTVADGPDIADELARELGEGWGGNQEIECVVEVGKIDYLS